jgi:hypothetical protein
MLSFLKNLHKKNRAGDTVVEVMISMTVLAVVIAAAYSLSTRSFQSSLNSQYRDQAISYSQQQLELIKEADNNTPATINSYLPPPAGSGPASGTSFCIDPVTKAFNTVSSTNCLVNNQQYTISDTYDSSTKTFKIVTSWTSADNHAQQSIVYYKANDSFTDAVDSCPIVSDTCGPIGTPTPSIVMSTNQSTVNLNGRPQIRWTLTNIRPGSCSANGPGGFTGVNVEANPPHYNTQPLTTPGANVFTINCLNNAGNPVTGSVTVTVNGPPTFNNFSVSSTSIGYYDYVTVSWDSPNAANCTANGPWSTGPGNPNSGNRNSDRLRTASDFSVTCTNSIGSTTSSTIHVNVGPSGVTGYYYNGPDFNAGPNWQGVDPNIDFGSSSPGSAEDAFLTNLRARTGSGYPASCVSVRWYAIFWIDNAGPWTFTAQVDDGMRLYIDNVLAIDNWVQLSEHSVSSSPINLAAGWHDIRYDYKNQNGAGCGSDDSFAVARLLWAGPGVPQQIVPSDHLRPN